MKTRRRRLGSQSIGQDYASPQAPNTIGNNLQIFRFRIKRFMSHMVVEIAASPKRRLVAVGREGGFVDVYGVRSMSFTKFYTIPSSSGSNEIKGMVFTKDFLFIANQKALLKYDLKNWNLVKKKRTSTTIWALKLSSHCLLYVCYLNGQLEVFDLDLSPKKHIPLHRKITSFALSENDLYYGSWDGKIRKYNLMENRTEATLEVEQKNFPCIILSIVVLGGRGLAVATNNGLVAFFDEKGISSFSHSGIVGCIYSLVSSECSNHVFAAGSEGKIIQFSRGTNGWRFASVRSAHSYNINALAVYKKQLLSAGVEANLVSLRFKADMNIAKAQMVKILPFEGIVSTTAASQLLSDGNIVVLVRELTQVSIYARSQRYLAKVSLKDNKTILCCDISFDSKYICLTGYGSIRFYRLLIDDEDPIQHVEINNLPDRVGWQPTIVKMVKSTKSNNLICYVADTGNRISIFSIFNNVATFKKDITVLAQSEQMKFPLSRIKLTSDGLSMLVTFGNQRVYVGSVSETKKDIHIDFTPLDPSLYGQYDFQAIELSERKGKIICDIIDIRFVFHEIDIHKQLKTPWSTKNSKKGKFPKVSAKVKLPLGSVRLGNETFFWGSHFLCHLNKTARSGVSILKMSSSLPQVRRNKIELSWIKNKEVVLAAFEYIADRLLIIELDWKLALEEIAPKRKRRKFGGYA